MHGNRYNFLDELAVGAEVLIAGRSGRHTREHAPKVVGPAPIHACA